jgi:hypothetical protein
VLSSKALWLLRVSLAMSRERSLSLRKSRAQSAGSLSWPALRRQQLRIERSYSERSFGTTSLSSTGPRYLLSILNDPLSVQRDLTKLFPVFQELEFDDGSVHFTRSLTHLIIMPHSI